MYILVNIQPFLNSMNKTNHDRVDVRSTNSGKLVSGIVSLWCTLFYCKCVTVMDKMEFYYLVVGLYWKSAPGVIWQVYIFKNVTFYYVTTDYVTLWTLKSHYLKHHWRSLLYLKIISRQNFRCFSLNLILLIHSTRDNIMKPWPTFFCKSFILVYSLNCKYKKI